MLKQLVRERNRARIAQTPKLTNPNPNHVANNSDFSSADSRRCGQDPGLKHIPSPSIVALEKYKFSKPGFL